MFPATSAVRARIRATGAASRAVRLAVEALARPIRPGIVPRAVQFEFGKYGKRKVRSNVTVPRSSEIPFPTFLFCSVGRPVSARSVSSFL